METAANADVGTPKGGLRCGAPPVITELPDVRGAVGEPSAHDAAPGGGSAVGMSRVIT